MRRVGGALPVGIEGSAVEIRSSAVSESRAEDIEVYPDASVEHSVCTVLVHPVNMRPRSLNIYFKMS